MSEMLKSIERGFRKFLIWILSNLIRSRKPGPLNLDWNTCKFLFVRQDRIGDVLISTPLFEVLKRHYPTAIVDVLLSSNNYFALENDPLVRKRWVYKKNLGSITQLLRDIRREKYDFVIDLMDNPSATSTVICLLSNARWTVGLDKDNAFAYDLVVPLLSRKEAHIVDRISQLLTPFGIDPRKEKLRIRYFASPQAKQFAQDVFRKFEFGIHQAIGINISAGNDVRYWGEENFRSLIRQIRSHHPKRKILLLFKPSHREQAERIIAGFENTFLSPLTRSFDEFAALIENLSILITPDTSAVHVASAFQVPAVVLYVQSDKSLRIWDPYGSPSEVLVADIDDLRVIAPEAVYRAAEKLMHQRDRHGRRPTSRVAINE